MRITYHFSDEDVAIDVPEGWGDVLIDLDRQAHNGERRETRRHISLSNMDYEGVLFASAADTEGEVIRQNESVRLLHAIAVLPDAQRELVWKIYFEAQPLVSIAAEEGVDKSAISHRL